MNTERVKRYDCTNGGVQFCQGCYQMEEDNEYGDYVKYEDYAALQKRIEELEAVISKKDRAIEHAEYLAKGAESLLSHLNDISDIEEGTINPDDRFGDFTGSLRSYVYEFRKRAERAALKAGDVQAPKEGWKLVPIEPTHEMVMNARKADYGDLGQVGQKTIRVCYKAMIAAAPTDKEGK